MDLETMHNKTNDFQYFSIGQFFHDAELMVRNCQNYNQGTSSAFLIEWAQELYQLFILETNKRTKELEIFSPTCYFDPTEQLEQMEQIDPLENIDQIEQQINQIEISPNLEEISGSSTETQHRGSLHYIIDNTDDNWDLSTKSDGDSWSGGIFDCSFFPDGHSHYFDQHESFDIGKYVNQL